MDSSIFDLPGQESSSLTNRVYRVIREKILNGGHADGEKLCELTLTKELGVSRTPVREALCQLELEGLVTLVPNKGAVVNAVSPQNIKDIYSIRALIEGLAAKWAAERITKEELEAIEEVVELMKIYTERNDVERLVRIDSKFHTLIFHASKSRPLINILDPLHQYVLAGRKMSFQKPGRTKKASKEHEDIYKAILDRNPDLAESLTIKHIKNAEKNLTGNIL